MNPAGSEHTPVEAPTTDSNELVGNLHVPEHVLPHLGADRRAVIGSLYHIFGEQGTLTVLIIQSFTNST